MDIYEWAKDEVRRGWEREVERELEDNPNIDITTPVDLENLDNNVFSYGGSCYLSALKAFKSLYDDNHSGMSIQFTKEILDRLIDTLPLTPIEDDPNDWSDITHGVADETMYQNKRYSALFKTIYADSTVSYSDVNRVALVFGDSPARHHFGLVTYLVDELCPITLPYYPSKTPIIVHGDEFLYDANNGDFDTVGVYKAVLPNGKELPINRYYKECEDGWAEIDKLEFDDRLSHKIK